MADKDESKIELIDRVFRDPSIKHGLRFFENNELEKIELRKNIGKVEIFCINRQRWYIAKPEEIVRQLFLVWIQDSLHYPLTRINVEWSVQMGQDADKERADL